ncbi:unnamed protein product [Trifolium pratense]|uniref:Uncharacterized protein n=1 Tax=Trifolium pratense TaxID=57577 RepID=A0ACB0JVC0_TRIPR|nr:unnamed protein product [Trifolium pratense]
MPSGKTFPWILLLVCQGLKDLKLYWWWTDCPSTVISYCSSIPILLSVAELFVKEIVRLHGVPISIISDRDPLFVSHFWMELFKLQGTQLNVSSAYDLETDGQTEVTNRCLESYLRCFASEQPKTWSHWIPWAEFWYNSTFHVSIGKTPFEVVYGRQPPNIIRFLSNEKKVAAVATELSERDEALTQLKAHSQQSVAKRINPKLAAWFYGPFKIIEKLGEVAYKLQLPAHLRIHPVFHVSLLKKAIDDYAVQGDLPKELEIQPVEDFYPEKVVRSRIINQGGVSTPLSLIQWKNKSIEDATWEDSVFIRGQFPEFNLEDKIFTKEGGIDRNLTEEVGLDVNYDKPKIWRFYKRKRMEGAELVHARGMRNIKLVSIYDVTGV